MCCTGPIGDGSDPDLNPPARGLDPGGLLKIWVALCLIGALPDVAVALSLIRGPYLQRGTPTSMVVRWRTDAASESKVSYGLSFQ